MTVRLGIVGCGRVTELRHMPALGRVRGVEVVALADSDGARLENVGGRFGVARRFADYRELIEAGDVEAVAVCVPPKLHAEVALAALEAGKHLFIEKPLALSLEECARLSESAARDDQLKVMVGFNLRWHRLVPRVREIIRGGELGEIKLVRTVFTSGIRRAADYPEWRLKRESGGGALFELGVHHFDLVRFLLDEEAREIFAFSAGEGETATVQMRLRSGAQVVSAFSEGTGENHEIEVYGARRWLRVSFYRADGLETYGAGEYPGALGARLRGATKFLRELPRMAGQARRGGDYVASYAGEWRHFAEAVRGAATVESTLDDGRRALELALAAEQASASGQAVKLVES